MTAAQPLPHRRTAQRLRIEVLEERTLLSAGRLLDFASLTVDPHAYVPSSILVRFRPGVAQAAGAAFLPGTTVGAELPLVPGLHTVSLNASVTVGRALAAYRSSPLVEYAEPNYRLRTAATLPNDTLFDQQWALRNTGQTGGRANADIKATLAWDWAQGTTNVTVAILDTGIDYNHPDLYRNVWINQLEIPWTRYWFLSDLDSDGLITFWDLNDPVNQGPYKIMDQNGDGRISAADILAPMQLDGTGFDLGVGGWANGWSEIGDAAHPDDLVGWNFVADTNAPLDTHGHGSHVAGIIGATGNNNLGVVGVNWRTQLMALKIGNAEEINLDLAVQALGYAVARGAAVSNHSYVSATGSLALYQAIAAAGGAGHIVVAAAGNSGSDNDVTPVYPAGYDLDNIIAVAATDHNDLRAPFSNYGLLSVHLGAPGANILSTSANGGYSVRSGTSMAAAYVSGAAAYLLQFGGFSYRDVINQILYTSEPIQALAGITVTGGRLSLAHALGMITINPIIQGGWINTPFGDQESSGGDEEVGITLALAGDGATAAPSPGSGDSVETLPNDAGATDWFLRLGDPEYGLALSLVEPVVAVEAEAALFAALLDEPFAF